MLESFRQLYDNAVDFCRGQSDAVMIGGAVIVILIILIVVIKSARKHSGQKEDLEFDEDLYIKQLLEAKTEKKLSVTEKKSAGDNHISAEGGNSGEEVNSEICRDDGKHKQEAEHKQKAAGTFPENCKKNVVFPDELIEEIARASSKDLQEVEIKIQSAELRIRYAGYRGGNEVQEEVRHFADGNIRKNTGEDDSHDSTDKSDLNDLNMEKQDKLTEVKSREETGRVENTDGERDGKAENIKTFAYSEISDEDNAETRGETSCVCDNGGNYGAEDDKKETLLSLTEHIKKEIMKEKIKPEEINAENANRPGKFGPDNFNTARSGRVFTEEELEKQIRD